MKKRHVDTLTISDRYVKLINGLSHALSEAPELKKKRRTSIWGVACQYLGQSRWKQSDYDEIKKLTIEEVVNIIEDFDLNTDIK